MSMATSSSSMIIAGKYSAAVFHTKPSTRFPALAWNPIPRLAVSNGELISFSTGGGQTRLRYEYHSRDARNPFVVDCANTNSNTTPEVPPPPSSSGNPMSGIIRLVISFILPFLSNKWGPLSVIKNKLEEALQKVEDVVEAVEKVAENVDKIAEDFADDLPEGKLRDLVEMVEHMAEETAKTADCLDNVIDKVQEAGDQVDDIVESAVKLEAESSKVAKEGLI